MKRACDPQSHVVETGLALLEHAAGEREIERARLHLVKNAEACECAHDPVQRVLVDARVASELADGFRARSYPVGNLQLEDRLQCRRGHVPGCNLENLLGRLNLGRCAGGHLGRRHWAPPVGWVGSIVTCSNATPIKKPRNRQKTNVPPVFYLVSSTRGQTIPRAELQGSSISGRAIQVVVDSKGASRDFAYVSCEFSGSNRPARTKSHLRGGRA
jgi:hypothetical protein